MPKFVRFSRDLKLGQTQYTSRVWYQVPSALAKQYQEDYPDLAMQVEDRIPGEEVLAGLDGAALAELESLAEEALEELEAAEEAEEAIELSETELEANEQAWAAARKVLGGEAAGESVEGDDNADVPPDEEGEDDDPEAVGIEDEGEPEGGE